MMGAEIDAGIEGLDNGLADARVRMAIDAGRIFAKEVDIGVAVDIGDDGTLAASDADRHRRGVEDGAGIAARHHPLGALMERRRLRTLGTKLRECVSERRVTLISTVEWDVHGRTSPPDTTNRRI